MVDTFTLTEFEAALESVCPGRWAALGLDDGEHAYALHPFADYPHVVRVRSSVRPDGTSAGAGEDSIRVWVELRGEPWGSKLAKYVTRVPGWGRRLAGAVARLAALVRQARRCPCCGADCAPFRVRREGANRGRWFLKCPDEGCRRPYFAWLD